MRSARAGPSTQVGWRNVKVSSTFSKVVGFGGRYVPVGRCSAADRAGRRDQTPGPSGVARGPGARWAPFRTGLRCHFGRCWASATGRQHPRRQPRPEATAFPYSQKEGTDVPLLGCHRARGFCLWKGQARCHRARSRGYLLRSVRPVRWFFSPAAPVSGRNFLKKVSSKTFTRLRRLCHQPSTCHSTPPGVSFITTWRAASSSRMASAVAQSLALRASARFWISASISAFSSGESSFPAGFWAA